MSEILMTPDVCMQFLVWSYYYHGVMPQKDVSYAECGLFAEKDVASLDELKSTLFSRAIRSGYHTSDQALDALLTK